MVDSEPPLHKELRETGLFVYRSKFDYLIVSVASRLPSARAVNTSLKGSAKVIDKILNGNDTDSLSNVSRRITGTRLSTIPTLADTSLALECFLAFGSTGDRAQYDLTRTTSDEGSRSVYTVSVSFGYRQEHSFESVFDPNSGSVAITFESPSLRTQPYNRFFASSPLAAARITRSLVQASSLFVLPNKKTSRGKGPKIILHRSA